MQATFGVFLAEYMTVSVPAAEYILGLRLCLALEPGALALATGPPTAPASHMASAWGRRERGERPASQARLGAGWVVCKLQRAKCARLLQETRAGRGNEYTGYWILDPDTGDRKLKHEPPKSSKP